MKVAYRSGDYRVLRNCCTSGNCSECRDVTPYGKPMRVVQGDHYTKEYAEFVAKNWARYEATVDLMPL